MKRKFIRYLEEMIEDAHRRKLETRDLREYHRLTSEEYSLQYVYKSYTGHFYKYLPRKKNTEKLK